MDGRNKKSIIIIAVVVAVNLALTFGKLYVGLATNSICVLLDATNSFFDVLTGIITLLSFILLLKPHKFGYGRVEYLATFIVAVVSLVFGAVFAYRSFSRLTMPEPVWSDTVSIVLISIAVPVKIALAFAVKGVNRSAQSPALKAVTVDSFLDAGVTAASLLSFTLSANLGYAIDAYFGIAVSLVVIVAAIKLIKEYTLRLLVGEEPENTKEKILQLLQERFPEVAFGEITLHDYGYGKTYADIQATFPLDTTYQTLTEKSETISKELALSLGVQANIIPTRGLENE